MNYLWSLIIIISFIFGIFNNKMNNINNSIFSSIKSSEELVISLVGNICFWCGIINIIKSTKIINYMIKVMRPLLIWLFPDAKENEEAMKEISINTISNILGIGNAATPAGIKAMHELQRENKNKNVLTNSMVMLIVLNTASIQILPTTIIAIRASLQSTNPSNIIIPIWISTITGTLIGIITTKIILKFQRTKGK